MSDIDDLERTVRADHRQQRAPDKRAKNRLPKGGFNTSQGIRRRQALSRASRVLASITLAGGAGSPPKQEIPS